MKKNRTNLAVLMRKNEVIRKQAYELMRRRKETATMNEMLKEFYNRFEVFTHGLAMRGLISKDEVLPPIPVN